MENNYKYLVLSCLSLIPLLLAGIMPDNNITAPTICLSVVSYLVIVFLAYQQHSEYKSLWYKPSNVFVAAYCIVNFQYIVDLCIGFKTYNDFYIHNTVNKSALIAAVGLIAFLVGYYLARPKIDESNNKLQPVISTRVISVLHFLLFIAWISTANIARISAGLTYGDADKSTNSFESLFYCATIALFVTIANNARTYPINGYKDFFKQIHIANWLCILAYCIIRMMSGDRGPFMYTITAIFFAFILITKIKLRTSRILIVGVGAILLINMIGMARLESRDISFSERMVSAFKEFKTNESARFSDKTISPLTEELALSIRCNQIAVNEIDNNNHPLHLGKYSFYQIIQCVPYVPSFLANTLKIPENELSSNIFMTDIYAGRHDLFQIGTTIVADSYFDFDVLGVIMMLLFIGYCFRYIDYGICINTPSSAVYICTLLLFASMAIYIPRSTFFTQLKKLVPILALYIINKIMCFRANE